MAAGFASAGGAAARGGRKDTTVWIFSFCFYGWKDTTGVYEQVEFFFCRV